MPQTSPANTRTQFLSATSHRPSASTPRFSWPPSRMPASPSKRTQPCFEWPRHQAVNRRTLAYSPAPFPADDLYAS